MKNELVIWVECSCGDIWPVFFDTDRDTIEKAVKEFKQLCVRIGLKMEGLKYREICVRRKSSGQELEKKKEKDLVSLF
ncbi:MAG: hypothetical protein K5770_09740 [Lachnospiraceae bacterium]|nr:hypothetical protein [Lachnospiraceae bacterium]